MCAAVLNMLLNCAAVLNMLLNETGEMSVALRQRRPNVFDVGPTLYKLLYKC